MFLITPCFCKCCMGLVFIRLERTLEPRGIFLFKWPHESSMVTPTAVHLNNESLNCWLLCWPVYTTVTNCSLKLPFLGWKLWSSGRGYVFVNPKAHKCQIWAATLWFHSALLCTRIAGTAQRGAPPGLLLTDKRIGADDWGQGELSPRCTGGVRHSDIMLLHVQPSAVSVRSHHWAHIPCNTKPVMYWELPCTWHHTNHCVCI